METVEITDLYQASYYLVNGCSLQAVECIPLSGTLGCRISFAGPQLEDLGRTWYEKKAVVNLWAFRSAYNQINSLVHQAKKNHSYQARQHTQGASHD